MRILPANRYMNNTSLLDVIFLLLLTILMLFVILLAIIKTNVAEPAVVDRNKYIIQMEWTSNAKVDLDMWIMDPNEQWVSYRKKSAPGLHLQHDDLGTNNDKVTLTDGTEIVNPLNLEVINIRQQIPGRYYVNVHMYKSFQDEPVTVKMKLIRVNPFEQYTSAEQIMSVLGEERTMLTFDINHDGSVNFIPPVQYEFIKSNKTRIGVHGDD